MNLSPEDEKEYRRLCSINTAAKQLAISKGDKFAAKRARQANTALYQKFKKREIPKPISAWEIEQSLTLEQRIIRIEQHLKIGRYEEN